MSRRLEDLLFQGETVEERTAVGGSDLAVTTHRVLVFDPDAEGRQFKHADCPNVRGATVETNGDPTYRNWTVKSAIYGVALLSGGYVIDRSVMSTLLSTTPPTSGVAALGADLIDTVSAILSMLSMLFLVAGVAAILAALVLIWRYTASRRRELVLDVAGRDAIRVPVSETEGEDAVALLTKLL